MRFPTCRIPCSQEFSIHNSISESAPIRLAAQSASLQWDGTVWTLMGLWYKRRAPWSFTLPSPVWPAPVVLNYGVSLVQLCFHLPLRPECFRHQHQQRQHYRYRRVRKRGQSTRYHLPAYKLLRHTRLMRLFSCALERTAQIRRQLPGTTKRASMVHSGPLRTRVDGVHSLATTSVCTAAVFGDRRAKKEERRWGGSSRKSSQAMLALAPKLTAPRRQ